MTRSSGLIDRLEAAGIVQSVDAALGRLLARLAARDGEMIGLVAALVSAALAQGHSCLPLAALHQFAVSRLHDEDRDGNGMTQTGLLGALPSIDDLRAALHRSSSLARDGATPAALVLDAHDRIYLRRYFIYERHVATALHERTLHVAAGLHDATALRASLARYVDAYAVVDHEQRIAVLLALRSRFLIITGGPGAGKTSTVLRMLAISIEQAVSAGAPVPRIALTAPTGKAAARLSDTLRAPVVALTDDIRAALPNAATTMHRLLGILPGRPNPRHDRTYPLPYDLIVVDEASMLDLALAARLCDALAPQARLILLGDRDQLASVEAGSVFGALCAAAGEPNRYSAATSRWLKSILGEHELPPKTADATPHSIAPLSDALVELRSSHRFGAHSGIAEFARAVRAGDATAARKILFAAPPELIVKHVVETALAATIQQQVVPHFSAIVQAASPAAALIALDRFRILCALREGAFGAVAINTLIEHQLRRHSAQVDAQGWFAGRLVMIRSNDYAQGLFNGDIGIALPTGMQGAFEVWLRNADGTPRALPPALLPAHEGAFALTVHKAQGSEFDEALIVLPARDARVLTRELLYTAVTRARKKVQLWTSEEILMTSITRTTQRWSGLADALRAL